MTVLVKATPAPKPRTKESRQMAIFLAGIFVVFAVAQLFTFDEFIELIPSFGLPVGDVLAYGLAPLIVVTEVFAIPFLLGMALSPAFRWVSMACGWIAAGLWIVISAWLAIVGSDAATVGYIGTVADLQPGPWALFVSIALGILVAWTSWGLWPGKRSKK